uniref:Calcineurin-like phosphoesterase domain-containing protein n=1 Tax=uncultured bacterium contig00019 TaxID=1181510 RepID=A0A806KQ38_9BACT|nr:hypothetical protein [uncultured bacterium contig00019]
MAILFSGDFHANAKREISCISKNNLRERYGYLRFYGKEELLENINYHIMLGDGSFMWPGNEKQDRENYRLLAMRPFPVLCVMGCNDPAIGMDNLPEEDIGIGGKVVLVNKEKPYIAYLKRGNVYSIDGIKMLVLGGSFNSGNDRRRPKTPRGEKECWRGRELWTQQEEDDLFRFLEAENAFDMVISHNGPHCINKLLFKNKPHYSENDPVALLNDRVCGRISFLEWWCGYWHEDKMCFDEETRRGYQYLYNRTMAVEKEGSRFRVYREFGMSSRILGE